MTPGATTQYPAPLTRSTLDALIGSASTAALPVPSASGDEAVLGVAPLDGNGTVLVIVGRVVDTAAPSADVPTLTAAPDPLALDPVTRTVSVHGHPVDLCFQEFELLAHLVATPGRVFSRTELLDRLWDPATDVSTRTVDVHVHRLRRKLGPLGHRLGTVRRVGYTYRV